ncbi:nucleoid-associated protein [Herbivorax sp. ANBcel31]|uniref:nucleoid-associated protein n=1 Tax=Herbivorax sp. ANBcel31 TaxID=3069754 RepID=UPI0027B25838|nr:nucleoid-associated protein [Herbivorax sp. ANBcel31]MDQ2085626.1 nucleoid-associated protein [Herbivorax sp. ANBcel31]
MSDEIIVKRAVLHVLDSGAAMPVISKGELEITEELSDYISKHIYKVMDNPNTKKAKFIEDENPMYIMAESLNEDNFLSMTSNMANNLFAIMKKNIDIPSADMICCIFEVDGKEHLGILKLNYKSAFTHWVDNSEDGNVNTIISHKTLLPLENQRVEECALIDLCDYSLKVLEKKYEINGEKEFYLSQYYLKCTSELSTNSKLKILDKVSKDINKKYFDEDFEKGIQIKKAVSESLEENESIDIEDIAQKVYDQDVEIKNEYVEEISKSGLKEKEIVVPEKLAEKKFSVQKIKTDSGIEVNFPLEFANRDDKIEFINNPDGTVSILIKNVEKITNR